MLQYMSRILFAFVIRILLFKVYPMFSVSISILDCNGDLLKFPMQVWMFTKCEDVCNINKKIFVYHNFAFLNGDVAFRVHITHTYTKL